MDNFVDYYRVLGIQYGATKEEIKSAYRRLAKIHHPDAGGSNEDFVRLKEAYDVLSDDYSRGKYDLLYEMYLSELYQEQTQSQANEDRAQYEQTYTNPSAKEADVPRRTFQIRFRWKGYLTVMSIFFGIMFIFALVDQTSTSEPDSSAAISDESENSNNETSETAPPTSANNESKPSAELTSGSSDDTPAPDSVSKEAPKDPNGFPQDGRLFINHADKTPSSVPNLEGLKTRILNVFMTNHAEKRDVGENPQYVNKPLMKVTVELDNTTPDVRWSGVGQSTLQLNNGEILHCRLVSDSFQGTVEPNAKTNVELLFFPSTPIKLQAANTGELLWKDRNPQTQRYQNAYYHFNF